MLDKTIVVYYKNYKDTLLGTVTAGGTHNYSSALKNYWSRSIPTSFQVQRNSSAITQRTGELLAKC